MNSFLNKVSPIGLLVFVFGLAFFVFNIAQPILFNTDQFTDFPTYYFSSSLLREGKDFYDVNSIKAAAEPYISFSKDIGPYIYPPVLIEALIPLNLFSYETARILWMLVSLGFLILLLRELFLIFKDKIDYDWYWIIIGLFLFFYPLTKLVIYGQVELLIIFLILIGWRKWKDDKKITAGIILGLAGAIKIYPLFFLGYFLFKKQWKVVVTTIVTTVVIIGLSFSFLPADSFNQFTSRTVPDLFGGQASEMTVQGNTSYAGTKYWPNNYSLSGLFAHSLTQQDVTKGFVDNPNLANYLYWISSLVVLILTIYLTFKSKKDILVFSLWCLTFLLINPLTWGHYLLLIWPAVFSVFYSLRDIKNNKVWYLATIIPLAIISLDIYYWHSIFRSGLGTLLMSVKIFSLILIYIVITKIIYSKIKSNQLK